MLQHEISKANESVYDYPMLL